MSLLSWKEAFRGSEVSSFRLKLTFGVCSVKAVEMLQS